MSPSPLAHAALLAAAALALATLPGCGEGPTTALSDGHVSVRLEEFRIVPQVISVPRGPITVLARNAGILTHNVTVEATHRDSYGNPVIYGGTPTLLPGQSSPVESISLSSGDPLPPGRYLLLSTIANQADLGMSATLVVR